LVGLVGAAGAPVVQHDDLVAGSKGRHLAVPGGRRHAEAVDEHQRRAFAVNLVIQFDAADAGFGHGGSTSLSCRAVVTGRTRGAAHLMTLPITIMTSDPVLTSAQAQRERPRPAAPPPRRRG